MTKVTKDKTRSLIDIIDIETAEGNVYITMDNKYNLVFSCSPKNMDDSDEYSFVIEKDGSYVYDCFDKLYDSIISEKPYKYSKNLPFKHSVYYHDRLKKPLIIDNAIDWHSEDKDYDDANRLVIRQDENADYILTFYNKSKVFDEINNCSVYMKNYSSNYDPYAVSFVAMYNNLRDYDFENEINKDAVRMLKK